LNDHKPITSAAEAVADLYNGATVMTGGFGLCGFPENLLHALSERNVTNLYTISNNMGIDGFGNGLVARTEHDCLPHRQLRWRKRGS